MAFDLKLATCLIIITLLCYTNCNVWCMGPGLSYPTKFTLCPCKFFNHLAKEERAGCHVIAIWLLYSIVFSAGSVGWLSV